MLRIREKEHQAFHQVFDNRTFLWQLRKLKWLNGPSLSDRICRDVDELLSLYKWEDELYAYKDGVLIPRKFLESQWKEHRN